MSELTDWLRLRAGIELKIGRNAIAQKLLDAAAEIERLTAIAAKDEARLRYLAGTYKENDGPVIEGFANVFNDIYCFIGDAIRERIGEENDSLDVEPTSDDMLAGMRAMIDASIEAAQKARAE